jgi:hypothetical protein
MVDGFIFNQTDECSLQYCKLVLRLSKGARAPNWQFRGNVVARIGPCYAAYLRIAEKHIGSFSRGCVMLIVSVECLANGSAASIASYYFFAESEGEWYSHPTRNCGTYQRVVCDSFGKTPACINACSVEQQPETYAKKQDVGRK